MLTKSAQFAALFSLGIGLATVITLGARQFPAIREMIYAIAAFLLFLILIALLVGMGSHATSGSPSLMIKILAVLTAIATPILFGIALGVWG